MKKYMKHFVLTLLALIGLSSFSAMAKDVTLHIRYNSKTGFCVSQTMDSESPIDVYILPYNGYSITTIGRYAGLTNEDSNPINTVSFNGGHYVETAPIGQDMTLVVNTTRNGGPTTSVDDNLANSPVVVLVSGHNIVVEGADDDDVVTVTNIAGQTVYSGVSKSVNVAESGIYIVTVGNNSQKVVVK